MSDMFTPKHQPAKKIYEAFMEEAKNRSFFSVDEWIANERIAVLKAANKYCVENNLKQVTVEEVMKAENNAYGHSDYAAKFAIGVAEIIFLKNTIQ